MHDLGPSAVWWNGLDIGRLHCLVSLHAETLPLLQAASDAILQNATGRVHV